LTVLNYYRQSSDLLTVTENAQATDGAKKHVNYLANSDKSFNTGEYASLHTENPESPYYTVEGTKYGAGNIAWTFTQPTKAIDNLMQAPFHAIGLLREQLKTAGYGEATVGPNGYYPNSRVSNVAIISGIDNNVSRSKNILFPGNNSITYMGSFTGENPEPRESCGRDWKNFNGLPIFASLLQSPSKDISVSLTQPDGTILSDASDVCIVDEWNFKTSDPVYGPAGKSIIASDHLVFVIPKKSLSAGKYEVNLKQSGASDLKWTFNYINAPGVTQIKSLDNGNTLTWKEPGKVALNDYRGFTLKVKSADSKLVSQFSLQGNTAKLNELAIDGNLDEYQYCVTPNYQVNLDTPEVCGTVVIQRAITLTLQYPSAQSKILPGQMAKILVSSFGSQMSAQASNGNVCSLKWFSNYLGVIGKGPGNCAVTFKALEAETSKALNQTVNVLVGSKDKKASKR
jgi:hypothetical protein